MQLRAAFCIWVCHVVCFVELPAVELPPPVAVVELSAMELPPPVAVVELSTVELLAACCAAACCVLHLDLPCGVLCGVVYCGAASSCGCCGAACCGAAPLWLLWSCHHMPPTFGYVGSGVCT